MGPAHEPRALLEEGLNLLGVTTDERQLMTGFEQLFGDDATDVAGRDLHQDFHGVTLF